jgi:hypothetical protein
MATRKVVEGGIAAQLPKLPVTQNIIAALKSPRISNSILSYTGASAKD